MTKWSLFEGCETGLIFKNYRKMTGPYQYMHEKHLTKFTFTHDLKKKKKLSGNYDYRCYLELDKEHLQKTYTNIIFNGKKVCSS